MSNLKLGGYAIPINKKYKYLEVVFDLLWREHMVQVLNKCGTGLNILKSICKTRTQTRTKNSLLFYKTYMRYLGATRFIPTQALLAEAREPPLQLRRTFLSKKALA